MNMNEYDMDLFLNDPIKLGYLLHFCEKQFCSENVQFYMEVKMFKDWVRTDIDSFKNDAQRFLWTSKNWKQIDDTLGIGNSSSSRLLKSDHLKADLDNLLSKNTSNVSWPSKNISREAMESNVKNLWKKFLCDDAMLQICIPAKTLSLTINRLEQLDAYCCHIYDEALIDPVKTIRRDIMPRFLVSDVNDRMNKTLEKIKTRPPSSSLSVPPPESCPRLAYFSEEYGKLVSSGKVLSTNDFLTSKLVVMDFIIDEKLYKSLLNYLRSIEKRTVDDISAEALDIYNYFVAQGSAFEVSISSRRRVQVMTSLANPKIDAFASMDKQALAVVETQLPSFYKSKDFTQLIQVYITSQKAMKNFSCMGFF